MLEAKGRAGAGETNELRLVLPNDERANLERALSLAQWFGTVGGRSRNGWGSLSWQALNDSPALPDPA